MPHSSLVTQSSCQDCNVDMQVFECNVDNSYFPSTCDNFMTACLVNVELFKLSLAMVFTLA